MTEESFVNPYAFIPLRPVRRGTPSGHAGRHAAATYSGKLVVDWELRTPLLLSNPERCRKEGWVEGDNFVRLPGSSVRGAVRSLHETMFNGCLRIIDEDFVPAYRMPARQGAEAGWRLAVVAEASNGLPTQVSLCEPETAWVHARALKDAWPTDKLPTSGDWIRIAGATRQGAVGRSEYTGPLSVELVRERETGAVLGRRSNGATQVVLVTDTSARPGLRRRDRDGCYWAVAALARGQATIPVDAEAHRRFAAACRGSNDRRRLEKADSETWREGAEFVDVEWTLPQSTRTEVVARRAMASGSLFNRDVVWVKVADVNGSRHVVDIRLSQIWRRPPDAVMLGGGMGLPSVGSRLGGTDSACPCSPTADASGSHVEGLCLSCQVFGAVDARGGPREGRQESYAGHVRFGAADVVGEKAALRTVQLTPMGAPRPGSGNFYLDYPRQLTDRRGVGEVGAYWGSTADRPLAALRGRKHYWHADPDAQKDDMRLSRARYESTPGQRRTKDGRDKKMSGSAQLVVPAGADGRVRLRATVAFDQLDGVALATLIFALEPSAVLRTERPNAEAFAVHLGGGKPLGLGSAVPEIVWGASTITTTAGRYLGTSTDQRDWKDGSRWRTPIAARVGELPWAEIAKVLDLRGLGDAEKLVTYPPGASWDEASSDDFRLSYRFFQKARGERYRDKRTTWEVLPHILDDDQTLPIEPRPGGRR